MDPKESLVILVALFQLRLFPDSVILLKDPGSFHDKCSLILKAASAKLDCESKKCQLLGWQKLKYKLNYMKNLYTQNRFWSLPWFVFKLVPSQLEEVLKEVWSPEVSGSIFEEKRQFWETEGSGGVGMTLWRSLIWHAYSCGIILSTTDVLKFLSEVLFVLNYTISQLFCLRHKRIWPNCILELLHGK